MAIRRPIATLLLVLIAGCSDFEYIDTRVRVVDEVTGAPIAGAEVWGSGYAHALSFETLPERSSALTNANGVAEVKVARYEDFVFPQVWVSAERQGFETWRSTVKSLMEGLERAATSGTPLEFEVRLIPRTTPVHVVTLPDDYAGYVRLTQTARSDSEVVQEYRLGPESELTLRVRPDESQPDVLFQRPTGWALPHAYPWWSEGDGDGVTELWPVAGARVIFVGDSTALARERNLLWPSGKIDPPLWAAYEERVRRGRVPH
ncbi:MAG: carboxypeptidase regulatory-like domain-containing protein [Phycisphaerales bacterium]|nr:carboxypeptidase regulatory-like domain-containing protein [Phycisphaerales bacterium]